ncbi:MAG: hypothetical protein ACOY90_11460 [Candidatus Zhuqueibacterota bacterium]
MPRHRRTTPGSPVTHSWNTDDFQRPIDKVEIHQTCKQLKSDIESLRLENKLNQQIQWLVDKRLSELDTLALPDKIE